MNWTLWRNMIVTAGAIAAVVSCGNGGPIASGGTGGTGISSGPVTGFGSIFVNSVEFGTTTSSVTLNGTSGPDEATDPHRGLKVGMVVEVEGTFNDSGTTGTADSIAYNDNLQGPVTSITDIDATTKRTVVLGQTVIIDGQTAFDGATFATLAVNNLIEVSGLVDKTGNIHATYVGLLAASFADGMEIEVKGAIKGLDSTARTFQINALTVDYSAASVPSGGLANGQYVEVKGTSYDGGVTMTAVEVDSYNDTFGTANVGRVEVEGYVTAITSQSQFTVGNQAVQTTGSTVYEGGSASNIAIGRRLEVEGSLANGLLTASKISFE